MKKEIFVVTVAIYDESDGDMWTEAKAFTDRGKARKYFAEQGRACLSEARGEDEGEDWKGDPEDLYEVDRSETADRLLYVQRSDEPETYEVKLTKSIIDL